MPTKLSKLSTTFVLVQPSYLCHYVMQQVGIALEFLRQLTSKGSFKLVRMTGRGGIPVGADVGDK
jgi:hypothetical protein